VLGKGGRRRTVLLDDPKLVTLLRRYLSTTGYQHGPLLRAEKNGDGAPIRYQSVHARWRAYPGDAAVTDGHDSSPVWASPIGPPDLGHLPLKIPGHRPLKVTPETCATQARSAPPGSRQTAHAA